MIHTSAMQQINPSKITSAMRIKNRGPKAKALSPQNPGRVMLRLPAPQVSQEQRSPQS